jgi:phosphatidylserine/phosphatidylglycerophosphate/cardiolipin synthase-like enzyme
MQLVGRNCSLHAYKKIEVETFEISGDFVAYASPDSTYAVTKRLFEAAKRSIFIGIYDFSADYMKELLLQAMERGVKVSLMLDVDSSNEQQILKDLAKFGAECVPAPSCASHFVHYFASSHEKVVIIDGEIVMVQSGNYSVNSIPQNEKDGGDAKHFHFGNRDMGVALTSKPLADWFTKLLRSDMKLETDAEKAAAHKERTASTMPDTDLLIKAPSKPPASLFPSRAVKASAAVKVTPVLTPDNYMDVVPEFLGSAKKSIYVEQQYIRQRQPEIEQLLKQMSSKLDVRIIVAKPLSRGAEFKRDIADIEALKDFGFPVGKATRILNPDNFVHCHNKLVVVDEKQVLISSQNWSDFAVTKNREAGLIIDLPELAKYYADIFLADWDTALTSLDGFTEAELFAPAALNGGKHLVRLSYGDVRDLSSGD